MEKTKNEPKPVVLEARPLTSGMYGSLNSNTFIVNFPAEQKTGAWIKSFSNACQVTSV